jgi:putative transposase
MPGIARRHQLEGSLTYHVFNRSHCRVPIFEDEDDFERFKELLVRFCRRHRCNIYHWAIMSNHYHLLIELQEPYELSAFISSLQRAYTAYYHLKYQTSGYLWQGRFKSQAIEKENYLLACGRYIERNPVAAGMTKEAMEYQHSSARRYCQGIKDGLTEINPFYESLGRDEIEKQTNYRDFLLNFDEEEEERFEQLERPMGYEKFLERLMRERGHYFPRRRGRSRKIICS